MPWVRWQSRETGSKRFQKAKQRTALSSGMGKEDFRIEAGFEGWDAPPLACVFHQGIERAKKRDLSLEESCCRTPTFFFFFWQRKLRLRV